MGAKESLINELVMRMSAELSVDARSVKDILVMTLYEYSVTKIETTELCTTDGSITENLWNYYCIGKLGSNKKEDTLNQYRRAVYQLCSLVKKELNMITSDDVQYYLVMWRKIYKVKDSTMESRRLYLSSVFSYLYKHKKIAENPMVVIEPIVCMECVKVPLTEEEIERIRIACGNDKRDLAMVEFFLSTGVRVSELCSVNIEDVDFINNRCKVLGKGNKERFVYFTGKCKVRLEEYLKSRRDIVQSGNGWVHKVGTPLFASSDKNAHRLHKSGVSLIVKTIGKIANVLRLHCHLFRATFATNLAKLGVDINVIARALGHANLNTVSRYVLLSDEQIDFALRKARAA